MTKKINEAQVKIDIAGLESADLETLSRMLALAGQAESQQPAVAASIPSMGSMTPSLPPIQPLDLDSIGADAPEAPVADPLDAAVDSLSPDAGDFGADAELDVAVAEPEEDDFSLDLSGQPQLESVEEEEEEEVIEEEFDFSRMLSLAGLEDEECVDVEMKENNFLPDLTIAEESPPQNSTDFGPYASEEDAARDGALKTNGVEGDNFVVFEDGGQYFWKRVVQEDVDNVPDPEYYDNEGNEHRVHKFEPKFPGAALGDNPLNVNESEEDSVEGNAELEDDSDETVDEIFESLQSKYKKFLGDK